MDKHWHDPNTRERWSGRWTRRECHGSNAVTVIGNHKPRVACLAIQPAPYQDPIFDAVRRRARIDLEVIYLFASSAQHPYWNYPAAAPGGPLTLHVENSKHQSSHDYPAVGNILDGNKYDAVVLHGYTQGTMRRALIHCMRRHTPLVLAADSTLRISQSRPKQCIRNLVIPRLVRGLGAVWVPGRAGCRYWTYYGVAADRIFQGTYCIDGEVVRRRTRERRLERWSIREGLGFSDQDFVFLFVGRLVDQRGLQYLLEAFRQLSTGHLPVKLLLVGGGSWKERIQAFCSEYGVLGVKLVPPVPFEQLPQYYACADAYVQPSIHEPYSLAVAQAAISGLPSAVTDVVGAGEDYVVNGQSGYVVPAGDTQSLHDAMAILAGNPATAKRMGQLAAEAAARRSVDWAAGELERAIERATCDRVSTGCIDA